VERILAIDQGTTSSRAILFDTGLRPLRVAQQEFPQHYPASGWVEHDPADLARTALDAARRVLGDGPAAALGITNQRETTVVWERAGGRPVHPAIVWQDRRTAPDCDRLRAAGVEPEVTRATGLLLDPYFSATKIAWILDHVPGARERATRGELCFGTVDSYLIWVLTGGRVHATDATNAARTLLFDINRGEWSDDLCRLFGVPGAMLPEVRDCAADFGIAEAGVLGRRVAIRGVAGDQQAATMGQACFHPGMVKSTYGTGCFALLNTGERPVASSNRLLTTIAYRLGGRITYALEGSIFNAGTVVQWLRDGLGLIGSAAESGDLAAASDPGQDVVMVPAFTGLGAPYWNPACRGAIFGLTRGTGRAELARAALESVGFQTRDLIEAMRADWSGLDGAVLRVDGGLSASDWTMQFLADILEAPVDRPALTETTARGVAWLAGLQAGLCPGPAEMADQWAPGRRFVPGMSGPDREERYARWKRAVAATMAV